MHSKKISHPGGPTTNMACVRLARAFVYDELLLSPSDDRNEGLILGDTDGDISFMDSLLGDALDAVLLLGDPLRDIISPPSSGTPVPEPIALFPVTTSPFDNAKCLEKLVDTFRTFGLA